jgi:hypothetical protein
MHLPSSSELVERLHLQIKEMGTNQVNKRIEEQKETKGVNVKNHQTTYDVVKWQCYMCILLRFQ